HIEPYYCGCARVLGAHSCGDCRVCLRCRSRRGGRVVRGCRFGARARFAVGCVSARRAPSLFGSFCLDAARAATLSFPRHLSTRSRYGEDMLDVSAEEFESMVADGLDSLHDDMLD